MGLLNEKFRRNTTSQSVQVGDDIELVKEYADEGSYQPIAVDLELGPAAGPSGAGDTDFLAAIMGNILGADLEKTHNYLAGIIGALSILGVRATVMPVGGVLAIVMDGVTTGDGIVVAHIDGGDPSTETRVRAAFAVSQFNDHASSGVDYGLDLKFDPPSDIDDLFSSGTARSFAIAKALLRSPSDLCILEGSGAPVDGVTGDNFAGKGSEYTDLATGDKYVNTGTISAPVWAIFSPAQQAAIDAAIAALIGGAPGALDTLNELAAALADDEAFATTVTNALALKANTADLGTAAVEDVEDLPVSAAQQAALDLKVTSGGALGTPLSGTGTNLTGIPQAGVTGLTAALDAKAAKPLFGYSNGQSIAAGTATPITGCTVTVLDDTFYQVDIWISIPGSSASSGDISTTGTAVFTGLLQAQFGVATVTFPAAFTWAQLQANELLHFSGTIQITTPGTIILNGLSINAPDSFDIDEVRMTLTPIGGI